MDARNKIIHGYDEIQPEQIWSIIINYLPILKAEVQELLND
ncbi:MAG: HepT-like ribonuclease domain-containing protein [Bacteroidales bacterium]